MSVARVYKAGTPYNAVELPELDYVQSFDVMYLAHLDHTLTKMTRLGHNEWTFADVTYGPLIEPPANLSVAVTNPNQDAANSGNAYFPQEATYIVTAINDDTGQESRPSDPDSGTNDLTLKRNKNTLSWDAVDTANRYRVYKSENEQAYGWIGDTETTSFTDDNIAPDLTDGPPEGFDPFADDNNPSTLALFEQRLFAARTRARPNAIYASRSADFENADRGRPLKENDGIQFAISAQRVNAVNSLIPLENLLAMTGDGIFKIQGQDDFISANPPPAAKPQSGRGCSRVKPLVIDEVVFYRPAIGSEVRTLGFSFEVDGYQSNDVSIFSPRLFRGFTLSAWGYAQEPLSVVWNVRSDGKMPTFTWQREQQVWGWTLCDTGPTGEDVVEDVISLPESGEHRVYLLVRRTIAGVERRFLERVATAKWDDLDDACYLDCAKSFTFDEPTQIVTGLWHLEGATVDAIADGFTVRDKVVTDGSIDLGLEATRVSVGLRYVALVETLPLVAQTQGGSSKNRKQTLGDAVVQVVDTRGITVGPKLTRMFAPKPRNEEPLGEANALYSGSYQGSTAPVVSGETTLFIRSDEPLPLTCTAIYLEPVITETP